MKKRTFLPYMAAAVMLASACPVSADTPEVDYRTAYTPAFAEAESRYREESKEQEIYKGISFAYFDLTGDGIKELVFEKINDKHGKQFWVYSFDGTNLYNFGNADNDADTDAVYGYKGGILYRESYKGSVSLYHAAFSGGQGTVTELYSGTYEREGEPPALKDLTDYYDASAVTENSGEWTDLDW